MIPKPEPKYIKKSTAYVKKWVIFERNVAGPAKLSPELTRADSWETASYSKLELRGAKRISERDTFVFSYRVSE